jgi:hypothetical protein
VFADGHRASDQARRNSQPGLEMESPETIDEFYDLINAYLDGMTSTQFIPNSDDCSKLSQIFLNDANATFR